MTHDTVITPGPPAEPETAAPPTLRWQDDRLVLLDQTRLPEEIVELKCRSVEDVFGAIRRLCVRGAPAIGCAAAYGVVLAGDSPCAANAACDRLAESRPTAVNLFWALNRMRAVITAASDHGEDLKTALLNEAHAIETEDRDMCAAMGRHGASLMPVGGGVLTHCNAGALATAGDGTALSVIFAAHRDGRDIHVYADETRPLLQGSRLTAWECRQRGVPVTVLCDNAAAAAMQSGRVQAVITGADRIAANGDAANKIGTYGVACLAARHDIPFYVAAPSSTFDAALATGDAIPIEQRAAEEVTHGFGPATAPDGVDVWNPAFDVTPAELITAIITERGVIEHPTVASVAAALA